MVQILCCVLEANKLQAGSNPDETRLLLITMKVSTHILSLNVNTV